MVATRAQGSRPETDRGTKMKHLFWLVIALLLPLQSQAEDFLGDASVMLAASGISADFKNQNNQDQVIITIDQEKYISAIPTLQGIGAINRDITQTQINTSPMHLISFAILFFGTAIVPEVYKAHTTSDKVHFSEVLVYDDDYGNEQKKEIASFDFTRELFKKINWNSFRETNLPKISGNFKVTPFFQSKFMDEPGL